MTTLAKGLLGLLGLFLITGTAWANHSDEAHEDDGVITVVVSDAMCFRGEPCELPIGFDTKGQVVTSFFMEFYYSEDSFPSVTAQTTFPEGWVIDCKMQFSHVFRCTGSNPAGSVLTGNPIYLIVQVASTAVGIKEIYIPDTRLSFFNGATRLPVRALSGDVTILAGEPACNNVWCFI